MLRPLRYRTVWLALGILGVLLMLALSLSPQGSVPSYPGMDKWEHAAAYVSLTLWFAALFERRGYWLLALLLLLLGVSVEFAQAFMALGRQSDWRDVVANGTGIGAGLLLAVFSRESWLAWVEKWLPAT